jgi:hypothetical protein
MSSLVDFFQLTAGFHSLGSPPQLHVGVFAPRGQQVLVRMVADANHRLLFVRLIMGKMEKYIF